MKLETIKLMKKAVDSIEDYEGAYLYINQLCFRLDRLVLEFSESCTELTIKALGVTQHHLIATVTMYNVDDFVLYDGKANKQRLILHIHSGRFHDSTVFNADGTYINE